ncbi:SH3 domain-containing protein [Streptomyces sp. NPDC035033]|uniref:SH3 domain-containing protein n=1 Tax=Streptomyces sp. NPDC035033 TaxID=3155368 RepID=UPI0033F123B3
MRTPKSRKAVALTTGALVLAGVLGAAGTASAAPAETDRTARAAFSDPTLPPVYGSRKVWKDVNHRTGPSGSYSIIGKLYAGNSYAVSCWKYGESVTAEGTTNNVWILARNGSGRWGYSSAIYFSGDKYANLPQSAKCP